MKTRKHMGLFCPKSGWRNTRKRTVGLMLASLLALQPTVFVYAEDAVGATTYTDGYRVHANIDGTRTVTFTEEVDIQDVALMDAEWNDIAHIHSKTKTWKWKSLPVYQKLSVR